MEIVETTSYATEYRPIGYSRRIIMRFLDLVVGVIELMLGLRLLLKLLGADPASVFVAWLYGTTDQLLAPFLGMFPSYAFSGNYVVEFSTIFAMIAYAFLGWLIIRAISFLADVVLRLD